MRNAAHAAASLSTALVLGFFPVSANAADRSVQLHFQNATQATLNIVTNKLLWGKWSTQDKPPQVVKSNGKVQFGSESDGFMTGTEGYVEFAMTTEPGIVRISWDNPFFGSNSGSCSAPKGYVCQMSNISENNSNYVVILRPGQNKRN
ncbi:MAG: aegerolysin family protein [Hyphomicrobiaceae bacterium]